MWSFIKKTFTFVTVTIALIGVSVLISFLSKKGTDFGDMGEPLKCDLAPSYEASYQVIISYRGKFLCSGTLISKQHVLTLAECLIYFAWAFVEEITEIKVLVGTRTFPGGTPYKVKNITIHPSYGYTTDKDNIAVIQLTMEVSEDTRAAIISLPDSGITPYKGLKLIASAYPEWERANRQADQRIFTMQVVGSETCRKLYEYIWPSHILQTRQSMSGKFCALADPGYSKCLGDRGSPATVNKKYIIGMYKAYSNSHEGKAPELFIDVTSHVAFIKLATT